MSLGTKGGMFCLCVCTVAAWASPAVAQESPASFQAPQPRTSALQEAGQQDYVWHVKKRFHQLVAADSPAKVNDAALVFVLDRADRIIPLIPGKLSDADARGIFRVMRENGLLTDANDLALRDLAAAVDLFIQAHYEVSAERPDLASRQKPPRRGGAGDWEAGYDAGPFTFYPGVGGRFMYDSNIFLERKDKDSDFIELLSGRMGVGVDEERVRMKLNYEATQWWHHSHEEANRTEHSGDVDFRWNPVEEPVAPYVRFNGGYQQAAQPVDSAAISLVEMKRWTGAGRVGLDFGDTNVEAEYTFLDLSTEVDALELFQHQQWIASLRVLHQLFDDLNVMMEGSVGETDFEGGLKMDNDIRQVRGGVAWQVIEEIVVGAHIGHQRRNYRHDSGLFGPGTDDFSGLIYDLSLRWTPDDDNRVALFFIKDVQESILSNFMRRHALTLTYAHEFTDEITWSISGSGEWGHEATDTFQRVKQRYSVGTNLTYQLAPPLAFVSSVLYRGKSTNDDLGDYNDWQATIGFEWAFGRPLWPE